MTKFNTAIWDLDSLIYTSMLRHDTAEDAYVNLLEDMSQLISTMSFEHLILIFKKDNSKCFRYDLYPGYKKGRGETPEMFFEIVELLREDERTESLGDSIVLMSGKWGLESDDVCAMVAHSLKILGVPYVVLHIDKDLDQISGWHISWRKRELYHVSSREAIMNLLTQCIVGDSADKIKGIPRLGPVAAKRIIGDKSPVAASRAIREIYKERDLDFNQTYRTLKLVRSLGEWIQRTENEHLIKFNRVKDRIGFGEPDLPLY